MKDSTEYQFSSILKEEFNFLEGFLKEKAIKCKNELNEEILLNLQDANEAVGSDESSEDEDYDDEQNDGSEEDESDAEESEDASSGEDED
jgi:structure-specific recognition protein 1